jgi:hypothetical protein
MSLDRHGTEKKIADEQETDDRPERHAQEDVSLAGFAAKPAAQHMDQSVGANAAEPV